MTLLLVVLLLLHEGYSLLPVVTVQLEETVTLKCVLTEKLMVVTWVHWYKQSTGDTLKLIAMVRKGEMPTYGPGFSDSRFKITYNDNISSLAILSVVKQDEGMYHCAYMDWTESTWTGTYLSLRGNSQRTSRYTVVQGPKISDLARPTNSKTLKCLVLSDSENTTCSEEPSVFWFRTKSDKSYPDVIYTEGKRPEKCENSSNNQMKCSYKFSKNISSSDADTYYCAVATCEEILFGNRKYPDRSSQDNIQKTRIVLLLILICLAITMTVNIIFICYQAKRSTCTQLKECSYSEQSHDDFCQPRDDTENGHDLNYAALHFTGGTELRGKKKRELKNEESVYSQVKGQVSM